MRARLYLLNKAAERALARQAGGARLEDAVIVRALLAVMKFGHPAESCEAPDAAHQVGINKVSALLQRNQLPLLAQAIPLGG